MIKQCTCTNVGQDEMYGKGNRAHNVVTHKDGAKHICTVCRKTNGLKGKMSVRKHPSRANQYRKGMNYFSAV